MGTGKAERRGVMLPLSSVPQVAKPEGGPRRADLHDGACPHPQAITQNPERSIPGQATHLVLTCWPFTLPQRNKITSYQHGFY